MSHNVLALFIGACIAERKQAEIAWRRDVGNTGEQANVQPAHINHRLLLTHDTTD